LRIPKEMAEKFVTYVKKLYLCTQIHKDT
jgi:hypothetical protein